MRSSAFRFFCVLLSAVWLLSLAVPVLGAGAVPETTARDLSVEVAGESAVLLENNGALPFESGVRIALFGYNQIDFHPGGGGSGAMPDDGREIVTVLDALQKAETSGQLSLDPDLVRFYKGISREAVPGADLITQAAGRSDAAVVCIGRWSEEGVDRKPEPGSFYLSKEEKALLGAVRSAFDKVVVLLNLCGVTDLSWATDSATRADALLLIGMPGQYGADCLPDLLLGRISPSGRLSDTFADSYDAYPSSRNFGQVNTYYEEDIYVGYRYFETVPDASYAVLYPFGYGLSYTTFSHTVEEHQTADGTRIYAVTTTNTGSVAGKDVLQLYGGHPDSTDMDYAAVELVDFVKTPLLGPGESCVSYLTLSPSDLAGYDDVGRIAEGQYKSCYVLEDGDYPVYLGKSSEDLQRIGSFHVGENTVVKRLSARCTGVSQLTRRLQADGTYETMETRLPQDQEDKNVTFVSVTGGTRLELEDYLTASGNDTLAVSGGALHNTHNGGTLTYRIEVEEDGDYEVYVCAAKGDSATKTGIRLYIDGEFRPEFVAEIGKTASWETYQIFPCGTLELEEGDHELRIELSSAGNLDYLRFVGPEVPDSAKADLSGVTSPNKIYAAEVSRIEAEHYLSTTNSSLSKNPGGYLENLHLPGTITYEIYCDTASDYLLSVGTCVGNEGGQNTLGVSVNGTAMPNIVLGVSGTGGWDKPGEFQAGVLTLPAGRSTLTLSPSGCGNLDYFTFTCLPGGPSAVLIDKEKPDAGKILKFSSVVRNPDTRNVRDFLEQMPATDLMQLVQGRGESSIIGDLGDYGIPAIHVSDGPAGVRAGGTWFPVSTTVACSWNTDLSYRIGLCNGAYAYAAGVDFWLAPAINIHRDPLCGRNFEYFSEDPLLTGRMVSGMVLGAEEQGVACTLKHFAMNNQEAHRDSNNAVVSERALREIYLEGFRIAIEAARPAAVMTSYNLINTVETSENADLLTGILRGEWGYDGLIMSDWFNNSNEVKELGAGNNLKMPYGSLSNLTDGFIAGKLDRETLIGNADYLVRTLTGLDRMKVLYDNSFIHKDASLDPNGAYDPVNRQSLERLYQESPEETGRSSETGVETGTPETAPSGKRGCGSVLSAGGALVCGLLGLGSVLLVKSRKDRR